MNKIQIVEVREYDTGWHLLSGPASSIVNTTASGE